MLTRMELVDHEHQLKDELAKHVNFKSYSLFFPRSTQERGPVPEYRKRDQELILPLVLGGCCLGWFIARGVRLPAPKISPKYLAAIASGVLEKFALRKQCITDALTGLRNRESFLIELEREIESVMGCIMSSLPGGPKTRPCDPVSGDLPSFSGKFGVIFLDLDRFQWINDRYGYTFGDTIVGEIGTMLDKALPSHVTASRFANDKFCFLLPDAGQKACFQLAEVIRENIRKLSFVDDVTGDRVSISASLGFVNYPQSMDGQQYRKPVAEQARMLVRKARRAVATAKDKGRNRVFGYTDILKKGGRVLSVLPLHRLSMGLGASVGARVGQRFLVTCSQSGQSLSASLTADEPLSGRMPVLYKAEVVVVEVQDEVCFAEVLHESDPAWPIAVGDGLELMRESDSMFSAADSGGCGDRNEGPMPYGEFLKAHEQLRGDGPHSVCLLRFLGAPESAAVGFQKVMDEQAARAFSLAREVFGTDMFAGRHGLNGLIMHVPGAIENSDLLAKLEKYERQSRKVISMPVGLAASTYPVLSYEPSDTLDNARKAMDHAMLLPDGNVAVFDSVSLNVSADRLWAEGDVYGAVQEFQLALQMDSTNMLARNSLGICYAQLGKLPEARAEFEAVIEADDSDVMALYNLGWTCHRLGEWECASAAYEKCRAEDPGHVFSLIRLGNLAERQGELEKASELYERAVNLPGGDAVAYRPLARVYIARGDEEQAREFLHVALRINHNDAGAMHMLARLYLDTEQDPQIAEVLARQSAALEPGKAAYWDVLVEALEAQDKFDEADRVRARAS